MPTSSVTPRFSDTDCHAMIDAATLRPPPMFISILRYADAPYMAFCYATCRCCRCLAAELAVIACFDVADDGYAASARCLSARRYAIALICCFTRAADTPCCRCLPIAAADITSRHDTMSPLCCRYAAMIYITPRHDAMMFRYAVICRLFRRATFMSLAACHVSMLRHADTAASLSPPLIRRSMP